MINLHASAVAFERAGVLIRGASGSGKSDLVLRLLDAEGLGIGTKPLRAHLIADDQVIVEKRDKIIFLKPPVILAGKLEIRGHGIVEVPWLENIVLALIVDLMPHKNIERMPKDVELQAEILGITIPRLMIDPTQHSACARIRSFPFHI
jgi:HPr kinase/phosphorylase